MNWSSTLHLDLGHATDHSEPGLKRTGEDYPIYCIVRHCIVFISHSIRPVERDGSESGSESNTCIQTTRALIRYDHCIDMI